MTAAVMHIRLNQLGERVQRARVSHEKCGLEPRPEQSDYARHLFQKQLFFLRKCVSLFALYVQCCDDGLIVEYGDDQF